MCMIDFYEVHFVILQLNLNVNLVPLNGSNSPEMEKPYISCRPSVSIRHLCHVSISFLHEYTLY